MIVNGDDFHCSKSFLHTIRHVIYGKEIPGGAEARGKAQDGVWGYNTGLGSTNFTTDWTDSSHLIKPITKKSAGHLTSNETYSHPPNTGDRLPAPMTTITNDHP